MLTGTPPNGAGSDAEAEAGSVVLAVLVLMLVVLFSGLAFATAQQRLVIGGADRDLTRAAAAAELGVHEAYARIDAGQTGPFSGVGVVDGTSYDYVAQPSGSSAWTVRSEATADDRSRALQATIGRETLYPFTLFVDESLILDRNIGTVAGRVGTNGTITVTGPSPGDSQELYRPDGACTGCADPVTVDGPRSLDPVVAPSGPVFLCPDGGRFEGPISGPPGAVVACNDPATPVVFVGDVTIHNPPLTLYVGRNVPLILDGAVVNRNGAAASMRIHVDGAGSDAVSTISATGAHLTALLYAPGRSLTTQDTTLVGSLTLNRLELGRGGRLDLRPDPTVAPLGAGQWRILDLRPVPPS